MPQFGSRGDPARARSQATMQRPTAQTTERPGDSARGFGELPEGGDALDAALADAEAYKPLDAELLKPLTPPKKRLTAGVLAAGAVVVATLGYFGYHVYDMFSYVDIPLERPSSTAVSGVVKGRRALDELDSIVLDPAADSAPAAKAGPRSTTPAVPPPTLEAARQDATRAPTDSPRPSRRVVTAGTASEPVPPRAQPCTAAIAAIGLCAQGPGPGVKSEAAAAAGSASAPPQASVASKAVERVPSRAVSCTEGLAALGLCTPESIQGRE